MSKTTKRTPRGKDKAHAAAPFAIRLVDAHGKPIEGGRWQVKHGTNWLNAEEVSLLAPAIATPTGEICGMGVVDRERGDTTIRITA